MLLDEEKLVGVSWRVGRRVGLFFIEFCRFRVRRGFMVVFVGNSIGKLLGKRFFGFGLWKGV